jgi:cytokinin dehydrogenase
MKCLFAVVAMPLSFGDWKDHFGPAWFRLREAARRNDPANVLTPGYDVF